MQVAGENTVAAALTDWLEAGRGMALLAHASGHPPPPAAAEARGAPAAPGGRAGPGSPGGLRPAARLGLAGGAGSARTGRSPSPGPARGKAAGGGPGPDPPTEREQRWARGQLRSLAALLVVEDLS